MQRTVQEQVDLTDDQAERLRTAANLLHRSEAAIVRQALDAYFPREAVTDEEAEERWRRHVVETERGWTRDSLHERGGNA